LKVQQSKNNLSSYMDFDNIHSLMCLYCCFKFD